MCCNKCLAEADEARHEASPSACLLFAVQFTLDSSHLISMSELK